MPFDGFISYSHAADGRLAPAVQRGLHRLAKPWHRRRALWIFRDQTGLAVTPGLWSSIQSALDGSQHFVLLASPEAARSPWVNREIEHWIGTRSAERILPVVTDGEWAWDDDRGDFTEDSTAVPPALRGVFTEEPFFLDLRWARGSEHLSLRHSRFRDAIAQLAAPMHGISKDELEGEDVRQHRRARRLQSGAAVTLVVLALLASLTGVSAVRNAERAKAAAAEALRQQRVADGQRDSAERSAEEARRQEDLAQQQQARATQAAAEAARSERLAQEQQRLAREQQKLADQAAAEARRQQRLADKATARTREQEQRAKAATERAHRMQQEAQRRQKEAERLAAIAAEQRRLAREAAEEARRQQAKADRQERIAVSRRLMNESGAALVDNPKLALMLGAAAQRLNPDTETRRDLAGVVTATHYAGTLGNVSTTAYAPDGALVTRGIDGRVSLWNVSDPRKPVRTATVGDTAVADIPLELSADGRTLAFVTPGGRAVLWNVADRSRPARLATLPNEEEVTAIAFSRDAKTFITGDEASDTIIWDTTDRARPAPLATIPGHRRSPVISLTISPNGLMLIIDEVRFVPAYNLSDRRNPTRLNGVVAFGGSPMAFSPDGATLAVAENEGTVVLYDMRHRYPRPGARVPSVPNRLLAVPPGVPVPPAPPAPPPLPDADEDPADSPTPPSPQPSRSHPSPPPMPDIGDPEDEPINALRGLTGTVTSIAFSPDGSMVAAGDENGTAQLWGWTGTSSTSLLATVRARAGITTLAVDSRRGMFTTADGSGTATLWNVAPHGAPSTLATLAGPAGTHRTTVFRPDGRSLIVAGSDGTAGSWNTTDTGRPVRRADLALHTGPVRAVAVSPDHRTAATVAAADGTLTVTDVAQPARRTRLTVLADRVLGTNPMAFSPDGRTLAVVAGPDRLQLWNVADRARPALRTTLTGAVFGSALTFSPDGRVLATGAGDRAVTLWEVARPARIATLTGHSGDLTVLTFSRDGRYLASGSADRTVALWDVGDRSHPDRLATLTGHPAEVRSVAFSPDGRTLATVGAGYTVAVWDTSIPTVPTRIATTGSVTDGTAEAVAFGRDGRTLAVTSQHNGRQATVTLWSYRELNGLRTDPARYACVITGRGLTPAEWARYIPEVRHRPTCPR